MGKIIRTTRSVCPVCLRSLPALLEEEPDGRVLLRKECPEHGPRAVTVWRGALDFAAWTRGAGELGELGRRCPENCGICAEHGSDTCCCLLEVTARCDLRCRFCFANGGRPESDPSAEELKAAIRDIVQQAGRPLLQLSGGEPTLREDLPELVRYAREAGCSYVQLNTNGIRLAKDPDYAARLAAAGLDIVFLQFDGLEEDVYRTLRGAPLLQIKKQAVEVCSRLHIGVTLVPTVVPGVNTDQLRAIVDFARENVPAVRGIHFQPVSWFGRCPGAPGEADRYTLDQLMADISRQSGIPITAFMPSRCDHPLCGFHANFLVEQGGGLRPLTDFSHSSPTKAPARDNREYVARHWIRQPQEPAPPAVQGEEMDFDTFLYNLRHRSLTLSAMAFQDAGNLNIERLHRCSLHVYSGGKLKPFCANYLTRTDGQNEA